tara:strand:+ start:596 stop:724 length:129 start_codon:yes stop_codon:yes gene_type:complete
MTSIVKSLEAEKKRKYRNEKNPNYGHLLEWSKKQLFKYRNNE